MVLELSLNWLGLGKIHSESEKVKKRINPNYGPNLRQLPRKEEVY